VGSIDTFDRCVFVAAMGLGGALFMDQAPPPRSATVCCRNTGSGTSYVGSAISAGYYGNTRLTAVNCTFGRNRSATGSISINWSDGSIVRNCAFFDNANYAAAEVKWSQSDAGGTGVIQELSTVSSTRSRATPGRRAVRQHHAATGAAAINSHAEANSNVDGDGAFRGC